MGIPTAIKLLTVFWCPKIRVIDHFRIFVRFLQPMNLTLVLVIF